jgi:two-component system chemotaxis response regulator CheB
VGAILTGMGADGAKGLLAMREAGSYTVAQNEETCVVYGMPREAVKLGAAVDVLPLDRVADSLLHHIRAESPV